MSERFFEFNKSNVEQLFKCFAGIDEYNEFIRQLVTLNTNILNILYSENTENIKDYKQVCHAQAIFHISLFLVENIEVIRELARTVNYNIVEGDNEKLEDARDLDKFI